MTRESISESVENTKEMWRKAVAKYSRPSTGASIWQACNTLVPYVGLWALMYWSLGVSYWLTLALSVLAAGFAVRIFIISHDCGHQAYFKSSRANNILGGITALLAFTPYYSWRVDHAKHHATSGNLDSRGVGDIWTMTVQEYQAAGFWKRLGYRAYRHPFVLFGVGPLFMFLIYYRLPGKHASAKERKSVMRTNFGLVGVALILSYVLGPVNYILIQLPIVLMASTAGVWLFYVQHQFEDVYWEREETWDYTQQALEGSSFYKLPRILQWFTGNIGFHHIHHLSPRIPNYYLERCYKECELFQRVKPITLWTSLKCIQFRLWDEENRRLISFREFRALQQAK